MVTYRPAETRDIPQITDLTTEVFKQSIAKDLTSDAVDRMFISLAEEATCERFLNGYRYFIACENDEIVGVIVTRENKHLYHFFVASNFQRRGIGTTLWKLARDECLANGNPGRFTVNSSRGARTLYESLGFIAGEEQCVDGVPFIPMTLQMETLMTAEIQIRRYRPDDVDAVHAAVMESKRELSVWMPWCHETYSKQDTVTWVEGRQSDWESNKQWTFLIVNSRDEVLGSCGIHRLDLLNNCGELGYWVRTSAVGRGIATEATKQLCRWAFDERELERIEILASVENTASQRVAEKAGGIREGILRHRLRLNQCHHDGVLYSILKGQFRN